MSTQTPETPVEVPVSTNPFPGLRPFEFEESHLFFGREGQSEQLIGKLSRTRFLAVVGTSGSGKSSLVRAGFLPALQGGFMTSAGSAWRVAILRPGNDPIGNLARALNAQDVFGSELEENATIQTAIAESTLRRGSLGLVDTVRQSVMVADENLLVVVDQFEEIFRFARVTQGEEYGNEAAAFIKLLLEASAQREAPIYVVLTMRSDYLGDCSQFWGLPEAINESQYLIPRLTRDQLREAIAGPVAVGGGKITPRLVNRLLNDVGDNQDQLPVLQHLLMRAWNEWQEQRLNIELKEGEQSVNRRHKDVHQGEAIDLCCAEAVGGMAQALSRHADEAYNELPDDRHREVAEKLFKALTEKGPDNREIRRPITLGELCAVTDAGKAEVIIVVETFREPGRSFLMPPAPVALNSESLVDISHESLIRGWVRLKDWVDEEARSSRIYRRLAETAVLHKEGGAGLWRDPDLQIALTWRDQGKPNEVWARRYHPEFALAQQFLDESVTARDAQVIADEKLRRREINRTRLTALIFGVAFLFSLAMGVYAYGAKNKADLAKDEAVAQRKAADLAKEEALAQKRVADKAKDDALAQKGVADKAKDDALAQKGVADKAKNEAIAQKREAESAKNDALEQKKKAETQYILAGNALKEGKALRVLKEGKADEAITIFESLSEIHHKMNNPSAQSSALADIADIHRDRAPISLFAYELGQGPGLPGDPEDGESQLTKQYYQMFATMSSRADQDQDAMKEEFAKEARVAVDYYNSALQANKRNTRPDRYAREANILRNLGDLQVDLTAMRRKAKGPEAEKGTLAQEFQAETNRGIQYYEDARAAYQAAKLYSEEAEVLFKIGDVHLIGFLSKTESKPNPTTTTGRQEPPEDPLQDPKVAAELERIIGFYVQSSAAYQKANKPLLQAAVLTRVGDLYESLDKDNLEKSRQALGYIERARDLYRSEKSFRREGNTHERLAQLYGKLGDKGKELTSYQEAFAAYRLASLEPKAKPDNVNRADDMVKKVGGLLLESSGKEKTRQFFEEAIAANGNDPVGKVRILATIGSFYMEKKDSAEAIKYYDRKREVWHQAGKFTEEGDTLFEIGKTQNSSGDIAGAINSFDAARKAYAQSDFRAENTGGDRLISGKLLEIAGLYAEQDKQRAVATYEEALKIEMLSYTPVSYSIQQILRSEGAILLEMNTDEAKTKARQFFQRVLEFYRSKKDSDKEALALLVVGDLYKTIKESGEARASYEGARAIYLRSKNTYQMMNVLKNIADLEAKQNPGRPLVEYYLREAESAGRSQDPISQAVALEAAANYYRENEKQKAVDYYERARLAYRAANLKQAEISVIRTLGYLYGDLGDKAKAEQLRKLADEMARPPG